MLLFGNESRDLVLPKHLYHRKRVSAFLIDETMLQIGTEEAWLWVGRHRTNTQTNSWSLHLKT